MSTTRRLDQVFRNLLMKPRLKMIDSWEARGYDFPGAMRGGESSPTRFFESPITVNMKGE